MAGGIGYCPYKACDCSEVELSEVGCGMVNYFRCCVCDFFQFVSVGGGQHVVKIG